MVKIIKINLFNYVKKKNIKKNINTFYNKFLNIYNTNNNVYKIYNSNLKAFIEILNNKNFKQNIVNSFNNKWFFLKLYINEFNKYYN